MTFDALLQDIFDEVDRDRAQNILEHFTLHTVESACANSPPPGCCE